MLRQLQLVALNMKICPMYCCPRPSWQPPPDDGGLSAGVAILFRPWICVAQLNRIACGFRVPNGARCGMWSLYGGPHGSFILASLYL